MNNILNRFGKPYAESTKYNISQFLKLRVPKPPPLNYSMRMINDLKTFIQNALQDLRAERNLDVGIAVLMVMATNLRSGEIDQLHLHHIDQMLNDEVVGIKIKMKRDFQYINANKELLKNYYDILQRNRPEKLILKSISYINKAIKKQVPYENNLIGLRLIRKINSKMLLDVSDVDTIRRFNRHVDDNVTVNNYLIFNEFNAI